MKNIFLGLWLGYFSLCSATALATSLSEQRLAFLQAENLLQKHDEQGFLTQLQVLKDYPLLPYLQAQWLKENLTKDTDIVNFLTTYKDNRYAQALRSEWLAELAKKNQWGLFMQYYPVSDEENLPVLLQCHFYWAQYSLGKKDLALTAAKKLWNTSKSQPIECNNLFSALKNTSYFTDEMLWQRFSKNLRGSKANPTLANAVISVMNANEQASAQLWLAIHANPTQVTQPNWGESNPKAGDIFAHAIDRLASKQLSAAMMLWGSQKSRFKIPPTTQDYIEQRLGISLAYAGNFAEAYARLSQANQLEEEGRHWLVRSALRLQNWHFVNAALDKLTAAEKMEEKWLYWQARTAAQLGNSHKAQVIYAELARKSSFYGFLAADKLQQPYQFKDEPIQVSARELTALAQQGEFKAAAEWFALGRNTEAMRQWWYGVKKLDPQQMKYAAKLAQQWQNPKLAAFTVAKADYWTDLSVRFPIAYDDLVNTQALQNNLDPALVLGLIRQESVFDVTAGSGVGARGLMQIMPATGKQIAKELKESWGAATSLYDPRVNLRYGTYYYKKLLDKFDGQAALAAAGYNAGPNRIKRWRPDKAMPMDIWIETIPFDETRHYVSVVLSNAIFYQQRMNRNLLKINDFMTDVQPQ